MPSHVVALLQRVTDLLVDLIGGKIELATAQAQQTVDSASRRAISGAAGALLASVGLGLCALAAVDALAPFVTSRPLRLLLGGAPLLVAGALVLARAASERRVRGTAPDHRDRQQDDREDQEHVDPRTDGVAAHHPEQPEHQQ